MFPIAVVALVTPHQDEHREEKKEVRKPFVSCFKLFPGGQISLILYVLSRSLWVGEMARGNEKERDNEQKRQKEKILK